jgi:RNA polymerase sigma-70 factor (ECF subfamily)
MGERFRVDTPTGLVTYFDHVADDLHRYVSRLTSGDRALTEDIVQDSFMSLVQHARQGGDDVSPGWIMRTAHNRFIDHVRSSRREAHRITRVAAGDRNETPGPEMRAISGEHACALLAALPEQERWALALHTVDELSVAEVAAILGRSIEATTSLLARARRRLRAIVIEASDD